jgi:hypothetical protein
MRWEKHVAGMGENMSATRFSAGKPEGNRQIEKPRFN